MIAWSKESRENGVANFLGRSSPDRSITAWRFLDVRGLVLERLSISSSTMIGDEGTDLAAFCRFPVETGNEGVNAGDEERKGGS